MAIVTPFKNNVLDEEGFRKNITYLVENGSSGIVACATTGESPSLSDAEFERVIKVAVEMAKGKVPVIAGAGTNSTAKTIKLVHEATDFGAHSALVVTPYYNKPTQEGLYQHYKKINDESSIPLIVYNVPSRTGCNIMPKTIARLARECTNIVGLKAASGSLDQVSEVQRLCGDEFDILSGDDSLTFPILAIGGKGVISVIANILPNDVAAMCNTFFEGDVMRAREIHLKLFPIVKTLFLETNPIPVKKAMELMGMAAGKPRMPLLEMSEANAAILRSELIEYGIKL